MILISAGHNPSRKGASYNGFNEHDEAVLWAQEIKNFIGPRAVIVPTGSLLEKVDFINSLRTKEKKHALEIHFNSAVNSKGKHVGRGCETLYCPKSKKGKELAQKVHDSYKDLFLPDRGIKEGWYQMNPERGPDYFLRATVCPAIILEPDFIHRQTIIIENRRVACKRIADVLAYL